MSTGLTNRLLGIFRIFRETKRFFQTSPIRCLQALRLEPVSWCKNYYLCDIRKPSNFYIKPTKILVTSETKRPQQIQALTTEECQAETVAI